MKIPFLKWLIPIAILIALCCINAHYEIFALNIPKGQGNEKAEGSFRVMTYNVKSTIGNEESIMNFKNGLIKEIDKQNPDVLCLQEMSIIIFQKIQNSLDSIFGYTDSLEIKKERYRYSIYSKKPIRNFKNYKCTLEIDTLGLDSLSMRSVKKDQQVMPVNSVEIELEAGKWITMYNCHLRSSAYSVARQSMDKGATWTDGVHLYYHNYKQGERIRNYEADNFRLLLDSIEANNIPVIIAGDFNDWSGSYSLETIRNGYLKDAWWDGGFGFGFTYDDWHLKLRLDHILYSPHFKLHFVNIEQTKFSDHYPLIADFKLAKD